MEFCNIISVGQSDCTYQCSFGDTLIKIIIYVCMCQQTLAISSVWWAHESPVAEGKGPPPHSNRPPECGWLVGRFCLST